MEYSENFIAREEVNHFINDVSSNVYKWELNPSIDINRIIGNIDKGRSSLIKGTCLGITKNMIHVSDYCNINLFHMIKIYYNDSYYEILAEKSLLKNEIVDMFDLYNCKPINPHIHVDHNLCEMFEKQCKLFSMLNGALVNII